MHYYVSHCCCTIEAKTNITLSQHRIDIPCKFIFQLFFRTSENSALHLHHQGFLCYTDSLPCYINEMVMTVIRNIKLLINLLYNNGYNLRSHLSLKSQFKTSSCAAILAIGQPATM